MSEPTGSLESRYTELQRLATFLLDKVGGSVTITEQEQAEVDFDGVEIHAWRNPATFDFEVRLVRRGSRDADTPAPADPAGWADIWSEYRGFFDSLGMDEGEARELFRSALADAERLTGSADGEAVADVLKERLLEGSLKW